MTAVTQSELTDFNLKYHIAPVVPKFMAIAGVVIACAWFVSAAMGNPNLGYLAVVHGLSSVLMVLLGIACHRTASASRARSTTLICIVFVFVSASMLCLTAANNGTGLLQSLPYCMVLTAVGGFFWPNRWGLVIGSLAAMTPPIGLVTAGYAVLTVTPRFAWIYLQVWVFALSMSFLLYLFMNQVRRRYLAALHDLEEQSRRDMLTGLLNRRSFYEQGAALRSDASSRESGTGGLLVYLDIDHFKAVNDRYGHAEGDLVLNRVAHALQVACEESDVLARFGGEEFVIYRAGKDHADAGFLPLVSRIQEGLRQTSHRHGGKTITVSVGGTALMADEDLDRGLQRADLALLRAKQAGRNRAIFFTDVAGKRGAMHSDLLEEAQQAFGVPGMQQMATA